MREEEQIANERRQIITLNLKSIKITKKKKKNLYQKIHRDNSRYYRFVSRDYRTLNKLSLYLVIANYYRRTIKSYRTTIYF